jgi:hypothetical protein
VSAATADAEGIDAAAETTPLEPSNTPALLSRLLAALVAATLLVGIGGIVTYTKARAAISHVSTLGEPVVVEIGAARAALADADRLALTLAVPGRAAPNAGSNALSGLGTQYQNDIAVAEQSLDQATVDNVAGPQGTQLLQTIEGLVVSYNAIVEQADTAYQDSSKTTLGLAALWDASTLMQSESAGTLAELRKPHVSSTDLGGAASVLTDLDALRIEEQTALDQQRASAWNAQWPVAALIAAALILAAALICTQIQVSRRFRRGWNIRLLAATLLVLLLAAATAQVFSFREDLSAGLRTYTTVSADYGAETDALRVESQFSFESQLCSGAAELCTVTLASALGDYTRDVSSQADYAALNQAAASGTLPDLVAEDQQEVADGREAYAADVQSANADDGLWLAVIALSTALAPILISWALWSRLQEYRYRTR